MDAKSSPYGGISHIGSEGQRFYVYVGGPPTSETPVNLQNLDSEVQFKSLSSSKNLLNGSSAKNAGKSTEKIKRSLEEVNRESVAPNIIPRQVGAASSEVTSKNPSSASSATSAGTVLPICSESSGTTSGTGSDSARRGGSRVTSETSSVRSPSARACIPASLASSLLARSMVSTVSTAGKPEKTVVPVFKALSPFDTGFVGGAGGGIFKRDPAHREDREDSNLASSSVRSASSASAVPATTYKPVYSGGRSPPETGMGGGAGFRAGFIARGESPIDEDLLDEEVVNEDLTDEELAGEPYVEGNLKIRETSSPGSSSGGNGATGSSLSGSSGGTASDVRSPGEAANNSAPNIYCIKSSMAAARGAYINGTDCDAAQKMLLADDKILETQSWTTEGGGGVKLPFVGYQGSCFIQIDVSDSPFGGGPPLTTNDTFTLLKAVYYANEIVQGCVAEQSTTYGGVARLGQGQFYVSVTALDPRSNANNSDILDALDKGEKNGAAAEDNGAKSSSDSKKGDMPIIPGGGNKVSGPVG
ncbi:MAG: hypothetical protein Q9164_005988 [Protoblastenia rupestris]